MSERDDEVERFLAWRGVDTPCRGCGGAGTRSYGSTATWRGGVGGQSMTSDVCDRCWGTGDADRHGTNLRELNERMKSARRDGARAMQEACIQAVRAQSPIKTPNLFQLDGPTWRACLDLVERVLDCTKPEDV